LKVPAINLSPRLILPGLGVVVFLFAYLAQNVWHLFHIDDITRAIRNLDQAGVVTGMAVLGFVEATIVLCFYVPGTAVVIVLLLGMQPGWAQAWPLVAGLTAGTLLGYGASLVLGRVLQQRLPSLVGEAYFRKMQSWIERYGLAVFVPGAFHPNQLAIGFAILGYFRAARVWRYFVVAGLAQLVWWSIYASAAGLVASQNVVSSSNFQLYVAALFSVWFLYELFSRQPQNVP
jgi:membrane protein DedA with SNARE-associated domain